MAIVPPVIVVMEKACRNAAKSLIRDFGELEKLQISKKDKNDFVSSADIKASETISYTLGKDRILLCLSQTHLTEQKISYMEMVTLQ